MPTIQTCERDPDRRGGGFLFLTLHTQVLSLPARQISTDRRNTFLTTKHSGREVRGTAMFDDRDKDKCVIVEEVTGTDRPSVWFEMDRWMDGRMKWRKRNVPLA